MNTDNHIITDEQLAAYISHKASPEDTALIEAWLAADHSHIDELLDMTVAAALPKVRRGVVAHQWYRRPVYWAAVAMVAIVIGSIAFLWQHNAEPDNTPMVAQEETFEPMSLSDPVLTEQSTVMKETTKQGMTLQRDERVTALQSSVSVAEPILEISFPRRQREVCGVGQDITFRFSSNAAQLTLTVADGDGNTLLNADVAGEEQYTIPAARIGDNIAIQWTLSALFAEGQSQRRAGTIELR